MRLAASVMSLSVSAALPASAGTWQPLVNPFPSTTILDSDGTPLGPGGAAAPLLMTDGTVIVQNSGYGGADGKMYRLTPDITGSYVNGTWSEIAQMPYDPIDNSQAVLPDGRVLVEGGEYTGPNPQFLLTNQGAIYDPVANTWTSVTPPAFFKDLYPPRRKFAPHPIGDSQNVILADGTFMLADKMSHQAALLDAKTMTWRQTGTDTKSDLDDEEGWTLLPNGQVLTVDCYTDYIFGLIPSYPANPTNSEIYNPSTQQWSSAGSTLNTLTDPVLFEMGPALLRPDGTVFATGSQGYTSIYNSQTGTWTAGPRTPISPQGNRYTMQDAPGALLPDGNVLFAASGGALDPNYGGYSDPPVAFFEFDGKKLIAEPTIPNAANDMSGSVSLLLLPNGQVLSVDSTSDVEIYTPGKRTFISAWAPVITGARHTLMPGQSYKITGIRFNGMSQAVSFGDELQAATNYPLVRITNIATGHVFYARTHDHSSMAVASPATVSTTFDVPATLEAGRSKLEVVANGIPSKPLPVTVQ
jgi:hypothetical protein